MKEILLISKKNRTKWNRNTGLNYKGKNENKDKL